ncbi:MAG: hypothetical protein ABSB75_00115 [Candidatus Limnocylindrales bacterium]
MRLLVGSWSDLPSAGRRARPRSFALPFLAAFGLSMLCLVSVALATARPAAAADASTPPLTPGRHVYDNGSLLSTRSAATAETLAAHIEATGGGRVVIYTVGEKASMPSDDTLAQGWQVDGMLLTGQGSMGRLTIGATLKGKLTADQKALLNANSSPGMATTESWILSSLARVDGLLSGTHVFDGTGILDATGRQHAEKAATDLGAALGATVYVDIALSDDDPRTTAFFNGADISNQLGKSLVIALAVSGSKIGGYIDSDSSLWDAYQTNKPWASDVLANQDAANGDVQAALLAAIDAVQKPPLLSGEAIFWIIFVVVVVLFSITAPFLWGPWLIRKMAGVSAPIKNALPGDAIIESIGETGITVTMPSVGPDAPDYELGLRVTPASGGDPYQVSIKALIPRIYQPMIVPGAQVGVLIDPTNPLKVTLDLSRIGPAFAAGSASLASGAAVMSVAGVPVSFDAAGQPSDAQVTALVSGIRSGAVPQIKGSAAQLLATGTHGTAVITSAQPLGKTVRDLNPSADADKLNDPVWLFTLEVSLAGQAPFPAMFGHRVPLAKVSSVAPGVKLAVAVNEAEKNADVAIDWDRSPLPS